MRRECMDTNLSIVRRRECMDTNLSIVKRRECMDTNLSIVRRRECMDTNLSTVRRRIWWTEEIENIFGKVIILYIRVSLRNKTLFDFIDFIL